MLCAAQNSPARHCFMDVGYDIRVTKVGGRLGVAAQGELFARGHTRSKTMYKI